MAVLKEELEMWRNHPVTQELMSELASSMENYVAEMVRRNKPDPDRDQWIRAYVAVATDVIGFDPKIEGWNDLEEVILVKD